MVCRSQARSWHATAKQTSSLFTQFQPYDERSGIKGLIRRRNNCPGYRFVTWAFPIVHADCHSRPESGNGSVETHFEAKSIA